MCSNSFLVLPISICHAHAFSDEVFGFGLLCVVTGVLRGECGPLLDVFWCVSLLLLAARVSVALLLVDRGQCVKEAWACSISCL